MRQLVGAAMTPFDASVLYLAPVVIVIAQLVDNVVVIPSVIANAVNLHPVAIILAILFFGGIWGLWGVFFAIPLATLIKAIINSWPTPDMEPVAGPEPTDSME